MSGIELTSAFVALLAHQPRATAKLLAQHVNDGTGHCRVCTAGGQTGRYVWPCPLHSLATRASELAQVARQRGEST